VKRRQPGTGSERAQGSQISQLLAGHNYHNYNYDIQHVTNLRHLVHLNGINGGCSFLHSLTLTTADDGTAKALASLACPAAHQR
jgi:hypothetical protein